MLDIILVEIKVNGEINIIVGLEISTSKLDEVQIIAYGTSSQSVFKLEMWQA